jgi:hypothetical protein
MVHGACDLLLQKNLIVAFAEGAALSKITGHGWFSNFLYTKLKQGVSKLVLVIRLEPRGFPSHTFFLCLSYFFLFLIVVSLVGEREARYRTS